MRNDGSTDRGRTRHSSWRVRSLVRHPIDCLTRVVFMALHTKHELSGVRVIVSDSTVSEVECIEKLQAALVLLLAVDSQRYRLVKRFLAHIIVWPGDYTAYDRWGGVHFASHYLLEAPAGIIAAGLVHEAVHLRISRRGIEYHESARARIEHRCVREQAEFLRRLPPDGNRWADEAEAALSSPWWTESLRRGDVQRVVRGAGMSGRLASIIEWWSRPDG